MEGTNLRIRSVQGEKSHDGEGADARSSWEMGLWYFKDTVNGHRSRPHEHPMTSFCKGCTFTSDPSSLKVAARIDWCQSWPAC